MKNKLKREIGIKIENLIIKKYNLRKSIECYNYWDAEDDTRIFEIKGMILKQTKRYGRAFIRKDNHNDMLLKCPNGKSPYYLFAIYYLIDIEPIIISVRIADWSLVNSLSYGTKNFQIGLNAVSFLPEFKS